MNCLAIIDVKKFIRDNNIDKLYFVGLDIDACVLESDLVESSVNKML